MIFDMRLWMKIIYDIADINNQNINTQPKEKKNGIKFYPDRVGRKASHGS